MVLNFVLEAQKASEGSVSETENVQSFKWAEMPEEDRLSALNDAENKYDLNIASTDLKVDEAVRMGFIDENIAHDIIKSQEEYLSWIIFNKPITKIGKLEEKMYGMEVKDMEVSDYVKGLLSFVREKTYYCSLMCMKMDNIKNVDLLKNENEHNKIRRKIREKTPEIQDYYCNQEDTSDKENSPKGKNKKRGK